MQPLVPGTVVDRYVVEDVVGSGAMAVVYRVRHRELGTHHALKVLANASDAVRMRMLREGRIQGSLRHPNVVAVTDLAHVNGVPALVMEYVGGPSLAGLLDHLRPSLAQIDALAQDLLRGVAAAHREGLVHRDLKPANVLLAPIGEEVVAKVADFGLAKMLVDDGTWTTRSGVTMGTPAYMAPEQFKSARDVDARADVFAAGATLYQLATGEQAIDGTDFIGCFRIASEKGWKPVRKVAPDLPERIVDAIEWAMSPEAADRPRDADALLRIWRGEEQGRAWAPVGPGPVWRAKEVEVVSSLSLRPSPGIAAPAEVAALVPVARPADPSRVSVAAVAGGAGFLTAIGFVGLLAIVAAAWLFFRWPETSTETSVAPPPVVADRPVTVVPVETTRPEAVPLAEAPEPVASAAPVPRVRSTSDPPPAAVPVAAAVQPAARPEAVVEVGGIERVKLQSTTTGEWVEPAVAVPGIYKVLAFFDSSSTPTAVRIVTIEPGRRYVLSCTASQRMCTLKEKR